MPHKRERNELYIAQSGKAIEKEENLRNKREKEENNARKSVKGKRKKTYIFQGRRSSSFLQKNMSNIK